MKSVYLRDDPFPMKIYPLILFILAFLFSCHSTTTHQAVDAGKIIFQPRDMEILEQVLERYSTDKEATMSALMTEVGLFFLETPYVAHTLETAKEQLVINLREMDCTTFAEYCLAISRTIKSGHQTFDQFADELQRIRYRDWIYNNQQKQLVADLSEEIAQTPFTKQINFMSTHPDSYMQLKDSAQLVSQLAAQEKEISGREMYYIPETMIAGVEDKLMDGDIAGITTGIEGLAIQHVVLLIRQDGRIHLLHASSAAEHVVVSDVTLEEYLHNSKSATGIMLARPL
jgi:hypothetical protein